VHSKARNRLADDSVHVHMSFSFNTRALQQSLVAHGEEGEELTDDVDTSRGTALLSQYLSGEELAPAEEEEEEDVLTELLVVDDEEAAEIREEEERKEGERRTEEERIQQVVVKFCEAVHVTQGFRWTGTREQQLQTLIIEAGLQVLTDDMKKRVKAYIAEPSVPAAIACMST
jgi:hypothetical protein